MSNEYFDGQARNYLQAKDDELLVDRLKKIKAISDVLASSPEWQIVMKDAEIWKAQMDERWQDVFDEKILSSMRIIKQAYNFISQIPERYKREVLMIENEIKSRADYKRTNEEI